MTDLGGLGPGVRQPQDAPGLLEFNLLRPPDLVALRVQARNLDLVADPAGDALRAGPDARLVVIFPPQHVAEHATVVVDDTAVGLEPPPPVPARAAGESRLVFAVPEGATVPLTVAGVLDAIRGFDLILNPAAHSAAVGDQHQLGADETAIEAPWRLFISPEPGRRWEHRSDVDDGDTVELWMTHLRDSAVRAVDARDVPGGPEPTSLNAVDRAALVQQSSQRQNLIPAVRDAVRAVDAKRLSLSALGATMDLNGEWDTAPFPAAPSPIEAWQHRMALGRDLYVRVSRPGFLFPTGHRASLIKVTERRIRPVDGRPVARLVQRLFIVLKDRRLAYGFDGDPHDLPFTAIGLRPWTTPDLVPPKTNLARRILSPLGGLGGGLREGPVPEDLFWPHTLGGPLLWRLTTTDHDGRTANLDAPLLFVNERLLKVSGGLFPGSADRNLEARCRRLIRLYRAGLPGPAAGQDARRRPLRGQLVAFAPSGGRDRSTSCEVRSLTLDGTFHPFLTGRQDGIDVLARGAAPARPRIAEVEVDLPGQRLIAGTPPKPLRMQYPTAYTDGGFNVDDRPGQVFLERAGDAVEDAVAFASAGTGGGFVRPDIAVAGLSRTLGTVGDVAGTDGGDFDPSTWFDDAVAGLPRLFGVVPLADIIPALGLDDVPRFVTERVESLQALRDDVEDLRDLAPVAGAQPLGQAAAALATALIPTAPEPDLVLEHLATLQDRAADYVGAARPADLSPHEHARLVRLARDIAAVEASTLENALQAGAAAANLVRGRLDWQTTLESWPAAGVRALFDGDGAQLRVSVAAQTQGSSHTVDTSAELTNFALQAFPDTPLIRVEFDRLSYNATAGRKPEVDCVIKEIDFQGPLHFVDALRNLIPLDGFSDPPALAVTDEGITSSFGAALPNVAVGVFSLTNLSLAADCRIPFLDQQPLTVGFSFASRERPFNMAVALLGGGGFLALRVSPNGLEQLELSLEAGAYLSIDFGVASGSLSACIGVYLCLEGDHGSLVGYFRLRGRVDVLGLITASIELSLSLRYDFATGKLVGEAKLRIEIDLFFFSASVTIKCQRQFAGSNADPTFSEVMAVDGVDADVSSNAWATYCEAFDPES